MCAQCMATAAAATGVLSGFRAWLAARGFAWLTPVRLKWVTIGLVVCVLLVSATVSGTGA
jgi:hypothetical protein